MKRILTIAAALMVCVLAHCQEFSIKDGKVSWERIYDTDMNNGDILRSLYISNRFFDIVQVDSTLIVGHVKYKKLDYESFGYSRMRLPMYLTNEAIGPAFFVLQIKEGKYRVVVSDIQLTSLIQPYGKSSLDFYAIEGGELSEDFKKYGIQMVSDLFSKAFTLEKLDSEW